MLAREILKVRNDLRPEIMKDIFHFVQKTRIWSHLLKKSLMENFIFCAVSFNRVLKK